MQTREKPITADVVKDALKWSKREISLADFCRKHQVGAQTAYRMLASSLAYELNK